MKFLFFQQEKIKKCIINFLLVAAIILTSANFYIDWKNTEEFGAVDLRNRVVGARLLLAKLDPYFFKWQPNFPDTLLDPLDSPSSPVSRITVPPSALALQIFLAHLNYTTQKFIWLILQWGLLLGTFFLLNKGTASNSNPKKISWVLMLGIFTSSYFWHGHVERGQIYIFYTFLLSLSFWLFTKGKKMTSGAIIGLNICLRPPLIFFLIPFLLYGQKKVINGALLSASLFFIICVSIFGLKPWQSYTQAMNIYADYGTKKTTIIKSDDSISINKNLPKIIEGADNLNKALRIFFINSAVSGILVNVVKIKITPKILMILLGLAIIFYTALSTKNFKKQEKQTNKIFLLSFVLVYLAEFFLPATRNSYNNVIYIPLLFLILNTNQLNKTVDIVLCYILIAGLYFSLFNNKIFSITTEILISLFIFISALRILRSSNYEKFTQKLSLE